MASQRHVSVGGVQVGGGAPVVVQTMTKTETANLAATMDQIRRVADAGADLVRVAVPRDRDVEALKTIVRESPIPVIADIHFNHTLALKAIDAGAHCVRLNPGNIGGPDKVAADIEKRLEAYEDPIEVAVLGCAVNGIGEASHADFGITGAKNEGLIFSRGKPLKKVPQERLVDELFAEIDKYAKNKRIDVDADEQEAGAVWLQRIEDENAGELTPERLAKLEAEKARADADSLDDVLRLDEAASPTAGRRF